MDMEIILKDILKGELERRSLSINELARRTGISQSVLHSWFSGVHPSGKNLYLVKELADYFSLTTDELLWGSQKQKAKSETLYSTTFKDGSKKYRLIVEKLKGE